MTAFGSAAPVSSGIQLPKNIVSVNPKTSLKVFNLYRKENPDFDIKSIKENVDEIDLGVYLNIGWFWTNTKMGDMPVRTKAILAKHITSGTKIPCWTGSKMEGLELDRIRKAVNPASDWAGGAALYFYDPTQKHINVLYCEGTAASMARDALPRDGQIEAYDEKSYYTQNFKFSDVSITVGSGMTKKVIYPFTMTSQKNKLDKDLVPILHEQFELVSEYLNQVWNTPNDVPTTSDLIIEQTGGDLALDADAVFDEMP